MSDQLRGFDAWEDYPSGKTPSSSQPLPAKIFHFTEIRFWRMCRASRLILEGRSCGRHVREPGLRWTRQRSGARRGAGRIALREPKASFRRAALLGFVSSVSFRLRRQGWKNCGEMAGRAYGKTVWSWPSLLRSSCRGGVCEPNRADSTVNSRGEGGQKESSAPGRARHKPSDHCAGKAE